MGTTDAADAMRELFYNGEVDVSLCDTVAVCLQDKEAGDRRENWLLAARSWTR